MPKLYQYQRLANPVSTTFAERSTPDKWLPCGDPTPAPASPMKVTAVVLAAMTASAFAGVPLKERVSLDKTHPAVETPNFDAKRQQHTYPREFFTSQVTSVVVPALSWQQETQRPPSTAPPRYYLYPFQSPDSLLGIPVTGNSGERANAFVLRRGIPSGGGVGPVSPFFTERSTPDKWHPLSNQPQFDLKRFQFTYQVFAADGVPRAERATPDKWYTATEQPQLDTPRRQFVYPVIPTGPVSTSPERVSLDRFHPLVEQPQFDSKRQQFLAQAFSIDGVPRSERTTPDKWYPAADLPVSVIRRAVEHAAPFVPVVSAQPPAPALSWFIAAEQPQFDLKRWQFTSQTFAVDGVPHKENVSLDRFHPIVESPRFDLPRWQYLYPNYGSPIYVPVPGFSGGSTLSFAFRRAIPAGRIFEPVIFQAPAAPSVASWHPTIEQPQFDLRRFQYLYTTFSADALPRKEAVSGDRWYLPLSQPQFDLKRQQFSYPSYFVGSVSTIYAEEVTLDRWHPLTEKPQFDIKRLQYSYPHFWIDGIPRAEIVSSDRWSPLVQQPQFDLKRQQFVYPYFFTADRQQLPDLDSWVPAIVQPLFEAKRQQHLYPSFLSDGVPRAESVSTDRWHLEIQRPRFDASRLQYSFPSLFLDPFPRPFTLVLSSNWTPLVQQPQFDVGRRQYLYPYFAIDTTLTKERSTPDKWHPLPNLPRFDAARNQFLYPALSNPVSTFFSEKVTPDRWMYAIEQPKFDLRRNQVAYQTFVLDPLARPNPVTIGWHPSIEQPQFDIARRQWPYPAHAGPISTTYNERVSSDRWQPLTNQPQFDIKRLQFTYQYLALDASARAGVGASWYPAIDLPPAAVPKWQFTYSFFTGPVSTTYVEKVTLDRFHPLIEQPRFDLRRWQFLYPPFAIDPAPRTEASTADRWQPESNRPVFDSKRWQVAYPSLALSPLLILPTPQLSGLLYHEPPHIEPARRQWIYPSSVSPISTQFAELVLASSWHPLIQQPRFDLLRRQGLTQDLGFYSYPYPFVSPTHPSHLIVARRVSRAITAVHSRRVIVATRSRRVIIPNLI